MSGGIFEVDAERWCELNDELDRLGVEAAADKQAIAALRAENDRLTREVERRREELNHETARLTRQVDAARAELKQADNAFAVAKAANVELLRVLKECEWLEFDGSQREPSLRCPICMRDDWQKHKPDCPLGRVLGRPECGG